MQLNRFKDLLETMMVLFEVFCHLHTKMQRKHTCFPTCLQIQDQTESDFLRAFLLGQAVWTGHISADLCEYNTSSNLSIIKCIIIDITSHVRVLSSVFYCVLFWGMHLLSRKEN